MILKKKGFFSLKYLILLVLSIFLIPSVSASWDYFCSGDEAINVMPCGSLYPSGLNATTNLTTTKHFIAGGSDYGALVSDLGDSDAFNEIVIWESPTYAFPAPLKIYNEELNLLATNTSLGYLLAPMVAVDFDNDSDNDILALVNNSGTIEMIAIDFNGSRMLKFWALNITNITIGTFNTWYGKNGMTCFNFDNDGLNECVFEDINNVVHSFDYTAATIDDDKLNKTLLNSTKGSWDGEAGDTNTYIPYIPPVDILRTNHLIYFTAGGNIYGINYTGGYVVNITLTSGAGHNHFYDVVLADMTDLYGGAAYEIYVMALDDTGVYGRVYDSLGDYVGGTVRSKISRPLFFDVDMESPTDDEMIFKECSGTAESYLKNISYFDFYGFRAVLYNNNLSFLGCSLGIGAKLWDVVTYADMNNDGFKELITDGSIIDIHNGVTLYNFSSDFSDGTYPLHFNTPIPVRLSDHDYLSLVTTQANGTIVYASFPTINTQAQIETLCWDTGSPLCYGQYEDYMLTYNDAEDNAVYGIADCYGDGTLWTNWTGLTYNPILSCPMSKLGTFNAVIYISDSTKGKNITLADSIIHAVTVDTANCNNNGENGACTIEYSSDLPDGINDFFINMTAWNKTYGSKGGNNYKSEYFDWEASGCNEWTFMRGFCPLVTWTKVSLSKTWFTFWDNFGFVLLIIFGIVILGMIGAAAYNTREKK